MGWELPQEVIIILILARIDTDQEEANMGSVG